MPSQRKKGKSMRFKSKGDYRLKTGQVRHAIYQALFKQADSIYSTSEKLKRILLGLLDKPDAAERPNHTRRTVSRAKNDSGRAPDAFRDAAAVLVAVAIDAAGLLVLIPSGDRATQVTGNRNRCR